MSHKSLLLLILFPFSLISVEETPTDKPKPKRIGNFANKLVPTTAFGFGQNVINKNQFSTYLTLFQQKGDNENFISIYPFFLYGITNALTLHVSIPTIPKFKLDCTTARGVGNINTQLEYAFYQAETVRSQTQATIVGSISFPSTALTNATRSIKDAFDAFGGYDRYNYFLGGTASHTTTDVYIYTSEGWVFNTGSCQTITTTDMMSTCSTEKRRNGDSLYYQFGIGHNLGNPGGATLMGNIECNGTYTKKDKIRGVPQENTGGNVILLGPTIYLTTNYILLQAGIQLPVLQKLNGVQRKQRYQATLVAAAFF